MRKKVQNMVKKRYKPFYKQFLRLRENVQDRPKLFKFNRQKWKQLQYFSKNKLKFYKRFKIKDQFQVSVSKFVSRGNSFQKNFKNNLQERKRFKLFYGGLKKKYIKNSIKKNVFSVNNLVNYKYFILKFFESRLDIVLYRAKFSLSVRGAAQLILHNHILVNGKVIKNKSYILKSNDLIQVSDNLKIRSLVKKNLDRSNFWPLPPKHLLINYRTLEIIFLYNYDSNLLPVFNHYLNLDSVIANIKKY